ncbi:MAG: 50S ribosomal protein L10 [Planctomycetaceae bacterium]|jgi:ribosomal protein L10|nr:50S ribosomal protein L10 [Planctomycetaceae bacterium]
MSKFVKQLITDTVAKRLDGAQYLILVGLTGIDANKNKNLRANLASKGINLMVIKNSLARRATEGTPLAAAFQNMTGSYALCWGSSDIVSLAKELVKLTKDKTLQGFEIKGAVLDGEALGPEQTVEVSKWPTREEQISILLGQIIGIGAKLSGQFIAIGGALASQIAKLAENNSSENDSSNDIESNSTANNPE